MINDMKLEQIIKLLNEYNEIVIYRHTSPDGDALGSTFGLKAVLKENFPDKNVYVVGSEERSGKLYTMFPKFDELNLEKLNGQKFLAIILDTANVERINDSTYVKADKIVKIDHHPNIDSYGDLQLVNEKSSSTSELVLELIDYFANIKIPKNAYKYLLIGIVTDTDRFRYSSTSAKTLRLAADAYDNVVVDKMYEKLYQKNIKDFKISAKILKRTKFVDGAAIFVMSKFFSKTNGFEHGAKKMYANEIILPYEVKVSMFISYDFERKVWKGSLRSKEVPINKLAEKYNGGGHELASGVLLENRNDIKKLQKDLIELIRNYEK